MNDDTDKPLNPVGDAALEARIIAWVLGEASPFEAAELEEICARDPEARLFERRMRLLHGFITEDREAGLDEEWKLPAEKRAKIEALFDEAPVVLGDEDREPEKVAIRYERKSQPPRQTGRRALLALAACTVISAAGWMLFSSVGESSKMEAAFRPEMYSVAAGENREARQRYVEELRKAVLEQEDLVEDRRKLLSQIERSERIASSGDQAARGFTRDLSAAEAHAEVTKEKANLESQLAALDHATATPGMRYASGLVMPDESLATKVPQLQEEKRQFDSLRSQGLAENHPEMKAKAAKLEGMEKDVKQSVAKVRETLEAKLALSNEQLARLDARQKEREIDAVKQGIANQSFADVRNDFETNQRVLEGLKLQLSTEEMHLKAADGDTALAAADQVDFLPGGGGGGSGGGVGMGASKNAYADVAPASPAAPAQAMRSLAAAPAVAEPSAPAVDSLAAVERKAGRGQEMDESLAKLEETSLDRFVEPTATRSNSGASGLPMKKSPASTLHLSQNSPFTAKPALAVEGKVDRSKLEADVASAPTGGAAGAVALKNAADASSVGLDSDDPFADRANIAGDTKSRDKVVRREMPTNPEEWFGRSATATPSAEGFDLQARFKSDAPAADAKVYSLGGVLHEDVGNRYGWTPSNQGAKGPSEFSDLAGMGDLATTTPLGEPFDIQSRFRGEMAKESSQMSLGGELHYRDSLDSGNEYDFGGRTLRSDEALGGLKLNLAGKGLSMDTADGFANLDAPVELKEQSQLAAADQAALPADAEPALEDMAKKKQEEKPPVVVEAVAETLTSTEPFSTFSLHVSDASFKMAKAALDRGEVPAADGIRPEEFYNAFDYGDPAPANGEPVVCAVEQSAHPALPQRNLLRIGVKTGSKGRGGSTPLNLTLLLDSSGSMEREDRNAGLANAVQQLSGLLKEGDTVSVIGFARQPRLLVDRLPGNRAQELNAIFAQTPSEGGTNLEEGLKLGEELALRQFNAAAQNRIVLFTDGAANLGDAKPETLQAKVEQMREKGIAFDAAGFGTDGLNDKLLERLTRNGNGRYYIVDRAEDADASFAKQLAGAFRPAAENVKVQVRFNPARVAKYKLIGFEEHRLKKEDFRNDAVDAAEMAAEEAGNALYQIETLPQGEGEVGEVSVRFRDVASGQMVERTWTIPYEAQAPAFDQATPSIQLAGLAAFAAEKLRGTPMADAVDFQQLAPVMAKVKARYANNKPVADLESMIGKLK